MTPTTVGDLMRTARAQALTESRILREQLTPPPPDPPPPLTYTFTVTCPHCAGPVKHVTGSTDKRIGIEARTVVECEAGCETFLIRLGMDGLNQMRRRITSMDRDTALNPKKTVAA